MRRLQWGRIVLAAVVSESLALGTLVAVVSVYALVNSPIPEPEVQAWAERAGTVVGPLGGMVYTFAAAAIAGRGVRGPVAHGLAIGTLLAAFDVTVLLAAQAPFEWVYVASNTLRVVAGAVGGWAALAFQRPGR